MSSRLKIPRAPKERGAVSEASVRSAEEEDSPYPLQNLQSWRIFTTVLELTLLKIPELRKLVEYGDVRRRKRLGGVIDLKTRIC